jgi:hypothetical protein
MDPFWNTRERVDYFVLLDFGNYPRDLLHFDETIVRLSAFSLAQLVAISLRVIFYLGRDHASTQAICRFLTDYM